MMEESIRIYLTSDIMNIRNGEAIYTHCFSKRQIAQYLDKT